MRQLTKILLFIVALAIPAFAQSGCRVVDPGFIVCNGKVQSPYSSPEPRGHDSYSEPRPTSHKIKRSATTRRHFEATHPCPANGHTSGRCPGYIMDHIVPLACGGPDDPSNLQWQTVGAAKAKDLWERKACGK